MYILAIAGSSCNAILPRRHLAVCAPATLMTTLMLLMPLAAAQPHALSPAAEAPPSSPLNLFIYDHRTLRPVVERELGSEALRWFDSNYTACAVTPDACTSFDTEYADGWLQRELPLALGPRVRLVSSPQMADGVLWLVWDYALCVASGVQPAAWERSKQRLAASCAAHIALLRWLQTTPRWHRKGGADFAFIVDFAFMDFLEVGDKRRYSIQVAKERYGESGAITSSQGIAPSIRVLSQVARSSIIMSIEDRRQQHDQGSSRVLLVPYYCEPELYVGAAARGARPLLASFTGTIHRLEPACLACSNGLDPRAVRTKLASELQHGCRGGGNADGSRGCVVSALDELPAHRDDQQGLRKAGITFAQDLGDAVFCPIPRGDSASTKRFYAAILARCVPVVISDHFVPAFSDLLDVETAIIRIPEKRFLDSSFSLASFLREQERLGINQTLDAIDRLRRGLAFELRRGSGMHSQEPDAVDHVATQLLSAIRAVPSFSSPLASDATMSEVTFGIKHVSDLSERRVLLTQLMASIRARYLTSPMLIVYEGKFTYQKSPESERTTFLRQAGAAGLSAGRNAIAQHATTEFVMILDDDVRFDANTEVETLVQHLQGDAALALVAACYRPLAAVGMATPDCYDYHFESQTCTKAGSSYECGVMTSTGNTQCDRIPHSSHITHNAFVARTLTLYEHPWDERQQLLEHETFFLSLQASGFSVAFDPCVTLGHEQGTRTTAYRDIRQQEGRYFQYMCRNFPRVALWFLPYWEVDCIAHTHRYVGEPDLTHPSWNMDWSMSDDRSIVRYTPKEILFFALIPSSSARVIERDQLRAGWLRSMDAAQHSWDYGFFIGKGTSTKDDAAVDCMKGDVVILANTPDEYQYLALKIVAALRWVGLKITTNFVLKVDTDTWVAPTRLAAWIDMFGVNVSYGGDIIRDSPVVRSGVWGVERRWFAPDVYPAYANGGGYVLSRNASALVVEAIDAGAAPMLVNIEDVVVGLAAAAMNITPTSIPMFGRVGTVGELECCTIGMLLFHKPAAMELCDLCNSRLTMPHKEIVTAIQESRRRLSPVINFTNSGNFTNATNYTIAINATNTTDCTNTTNAISLPVSPGAGTLQVAINAASAGDTLVLADGTYTGSGTNLLEISKDITIRAHNSRQAILDGQNAQCIVYIASGTVALEGLDITRGLSEVGGGVYVIGVATVTLDNCNIHNNNAYVRARLMKPPHRRRWGACFC